MLECAPRLCQQNFCSRRGFGEEDEGVHGNNERISVKNVRQGTREFYEVVRYISR